MYASLMALAVLLTAAGVGMVVFGIPINAFSLGNTLIASGVTAICGGLILVGLAAAYRQLRRVADAVTRAGPRVPRPLDLADPHAPASLRTAGPPTARIPLPPLETEGHGDFRAPEPHPPYQEANPELRSAYRPEPRDGYPPEPHMEAEPRPEYQRHVEPPPESRYVRREHRPESRYAQPPPRSSPEDYAGERQRARIPTPNRGEHGTTETDYPADRGMRLKLPASIAAVFGPRPRGESSENDEPQPEASAGYAADSSARQPALPEPAPQDPHPEPTPAPPQPPGAGQAAPPQPEAEEPEFTTVLKSGVVDGLAYTLYADGSIAAELPDGRRRFASIDELRAHLEQTGG
jgi:hypothetical protein